MRGRIIANIDDIRPQLRRRKDHSFCRRTRSSPSVSRRAMMPGLQSAAAKTRVHGRSRVLWAQGCAGSGGQSWLKARLGLEPALVPAAWGDSAELPGVLSTSVSMDEVMEGMDIYIRIAVFGVDPTFLRATWRVGPVGSVFWFLFSTI
jgi:hypothetical protein